MSLVHPDDVDWFVTLDETHHRYSSQGNKGGQSELRFACPSFPRVGDRIVESAHHTTGVYAFNLHGDPLPPLFIFDTASKNPDNYKIDSSILASLPVVTGRYGDTRIHTFPSYVCMRKKGSMDTSLWSLYNEEVILRCYRGRVHPTPVRDPDTGRLIKGPLINKTDGGPGRLSREASSLDFRENMAATGMHILLSLPNGTECTAELDQCYSEFKPACNKNPRRIVAKKMYLRVQARKKAAQARKAAAAVDAVAAAAAEVEGEAVAAAAPEEGEAVAAAAPEEGGGEAADSAQNHIAELEEMLDDDESDVDVYDDGIVGSADSDEEGEVDVPIESIAVKVGNSVCHVTIGNEDLGAIVNGFPGDPIEHRPFDRYFCRPRILKYWCAVGFLPMTRNAVNDPKVRYELGDGGAPEEAQGRLELLTTEYEEMAKSLSEMGFNGEVMDLKARTVEERKFPEEEEAAIQELIQKKSMNRPGGLFKVGALVANCHVVLEASRRMAIAEAERKKAKEVKNKEKEESGLEKAVAAFMKWKEDGRQIDNKNEGPKLSKEAAKAIVKVLLPKIAPTKKLKDYNGMAVCVKWLGSIASGTTWDSEMEHCQHSLGTGNGEYISE